MMTLQGGLHDTLMFESWPREPWPRGACKGSLGSEAGQRDRWLKRGCLMTLHPTSPAFLEGQPWLRHLRPVGCPTPCLLYSAASAVSIAWDWFWKVGGAHTPMSIRVPLALPSFLFPAAHHHPFLGREALLPLFLHIRLISDASFLALEELSLFRPGGPKPQSDMRKASQ